MLKGLLGTAVGEIGHRCVYIVLSEVSEEDIFIETLLGAALGEIPCGGKLTRGGVDKRHLF